jgi:GTPase
VEEIIAVVDHATLNRAYPEMQYKHAEHQPTDNNVNIVIIGHVDSGKSTLTGHLLFEMG